MKVYMVEVIRKSTGKVVERTEFDTYEEVLTFLRTVNYKLFRTAVIS